MSDNGYVKVRDVMTHDPLSIGLVATARDAIVMLQKTGVSSLVVERRDKTDEYGLVTVTDLAREVIATDRSPDRVNVFEIMTKPVITLPQDMNVKYACRLLVKFKLSRALVVDDHRAPCGIVTLRDMVLRYANAETENDAIDTPSGPSLAD